MVRTRKTPNTESSLFSRSSFSRSAFFLSVGKIESNYKVKRTDITEKKNEKQVALIYFHCVTIEDNL